MTIDWNHFTPWMSLAGGIVLGLASALFILFNGRVLGISGIFAVAALLFVVNALHEGLVDTSHPGYLAAVAVTMLIAPFLAVQVVNRLLPGLSRKLGRGQLLAEPRLLTAMSVAGLIAFSGPLFVPGFDPKTMNDPVSFQWMQLAAFLATMIGGCLGSLVFPRRDAAKNPRV